MRLWRLRMQDCNLLNGAFFNLKSVPVLVFRSAGQNNEFLTSHCITAAPGLETSWRDT